MMNEFFVNTKKFEEKFDLQEQIDQFYQSEFYRNTYFKKNSYQHPLLEYLSKSKFNLI